MRLSRKTLWPLSIGLALTGAIGITASLLSFRKQIEDRSRSVERRVSQSVQFESQAKFEQAVFKAIDRYRDIKRQRGVARSYAHWQAAPVQTSGGQHLYGNPKARFTLVERSDFECPYCKQFHHTLKSLVDVGKGLVNWRFEPLPMGFHGAAALKEAEAAECVAQQKGNRGFWVFADQVFEATRGNGGGVPDIEALAFAAGAEPDAVRACLASGRYRASLVQAEAKAAQEGVNGTPATRLIDHATGRERLLSGALPAQAIATAIRQMMQNPSELA